MYAKRILPLLLAVLAVLLITGCARKSTDEQTSGLQQPHQSTRSTQDREGRPIELPERMERVICLSPTITEMLLDLGLGDRLVAVDEYSAMLAGVDSSLPTFDMMTPDVERVAAIGADIMLISSISMAGGADPYKPISDLGVCVAYIPASVSMSDIEEDILFIGDIFEVQQEAQVLAGDISAQVEAIRAVGQGISERRSVYFEIMPAPSLYSFGSGTFLDEMLGIVGADNIFAEQDGWLSISEEAVLAANPDVVLANWGESGEVHSEILSRSGWDVMSAVREGRVYAIDRDLSSRSNHRAVEALRQIACAVYPEHFVGV